MQNLFSLLRVFNELPGPLTEERCCVETNHRHCWFISTAATSENNCPVRAEDVNDQHNTHNTHTTTD